MPSHFWIELRISENATGTPKPNFTPEDTDRGGMSLKMIIRMSSDDFLY